MKIIYYDEIGRFRSIDRVFWEVGGTDIENKKERGDKIIYEPQKLNAYSYVINNPVNNLDPDGEDTILLGNPVITAFEAGAAVGEALGVVIIYAIDKIYWEPKIDKLLNSDTTSTGYNSTKVSRSSNWDIGDIVDTPETNPDGFTKGKSDNFPNNGTTWTDEKGNIWSKDQAAGERAHGGSYRKVYDKGTKKPTKDKRKTVSKDGKVLRN